MEIERRGLALLGVLILQCLAVYAHGELYREEIGKVESRLVSNELKKRHLSHAFKRSTSILQEETDIDKEEEEGGGEEEEEEEEEENEIVYLLNALKRSTSSLQEKKDIGKKEAETPSATEDSHPEDGAKIIEDALKGQVDPNSDVVNLLESMYVDEGNKHNVHPDGIAKIASKKGKVFGDTHDAHKLTRQQLDELQDSSTGNRKRNFDQTAPLWTDKIIPYTIHSSLSSTQSYVDVINTAIQQFTDYTCLKWVPYGSTEANKASYSTYIEFFAESGCWSYVGRVFSDKQQISLQAPGCVSVSTTIHEMAHAIGQHHEQSRNDRDNHVTLLWNNINGGTGNFNMQKMKTHDYNPYDYESVLQYSLKAFSTNGNPTITFTDSRLDFLADSATGLMFYDIQDITDAYDCTKPCKGPNGDVPLKQCQNGGFVIHTCNCHCPDGLTGTLCESAVTDADCGPSIITLADGESSTITSPNFNNGGPYPTGKKCVWLVKVPAGKVVQMTIDEMDLTTNNGACNHWLEIQYNLIGQTGPRRCGQLSQETYQTSIFGDPTMMLLKFDSAFAASATAGKGFSLTVTPVGPGCSIKPCVYGTCVPDSSSFTCICPTGVSGRLCDIIEGSVAISCDFESDIICPFSNSGLRDWTVQSGGTPSSNTGPSSAHSGNNYLYVETSSPVVSGDKFVFETPVLPGVSRCLTFWYHMYGASVGTLNVLAGGNSVWTLTGDQGNNWIKAEVTIGITTDYKVTFEAIRGNSWNGDIAIDAISLNPNACGQTTPAPTTQAPTTTPAPTTQAPTTTPPPTTQAPTTTQSTTLQPSTGTPTFVDQELHCTFESGENCFLQNILNDNFDWTTRQGGTPSSSTGPSSAYEGTSYSYIEASGKTADSIAILQSPTIKTSQPFCLSFAYHMYGDNMGSLSVDVVSTATSLTLFDESGNKGDKWDVAYISVPPTFGQIEFTAVRGNSFRSDVAIDDIQFLSGDCVIDCSHNPCGPGSVCVPDADATYRCDCAADFTGTNCETRIGSVSCTFEDGEDSCFLGNTNNDDFDWTYRTNKTIFMIMGSTPSSSTGPDSAIEGVKYAYIETSSPRNQGDTATLVTMYQFESGDRCLIFNYNMFGSSIGELRVMQESVELFSKTGQQSNSASDWQRVGIDIYHHANDTIVFEGVRGSSFKGDIALDDIQYNEGKCGCNAISCLNGGTCEDTAAGATCHCAASYTGLRCESYNGYAVGSVSCTFEDGEDCFLENTTNDDFDWTYRSGSTPSSSTGPDSAIEGVKYAYIETSSPRNQGDTAGLASKYQFKSGDRCLIFNYNMFGSTIGELRVMQESVELFSTTGQQSDSANDWQRAEIDIYHHASDTIVFEGVRGSSYKGDIALDDIQYNEGKCGCNAISCLNGGTCEDTAAGVTCHCAASYTGLRCESYGYAVGSVFCTFEDGEDCFLENTNNDDFDWTIRSGSTPSSSTGPDSAIEGVKYAYIETSSPRTQGDTAGLASKYQFKSGDRCLIFNYNMFGSTIGELRVMQESVELFSTTGQQSDSANDWQRAEIDIYHHASDTIVFEGVRGSSYRGDIALDDIQYIEGKCGCKVISCLNGGTCEDTAAGATCHCAPPYTGLRCEND